MLLKLLKEWFGFYGVGLKLLLLLPLLAQFAKSNNVAYVSTT